MDLAARASIRFSIGPAGHGHAARARVMFVDEPRPVTEHDWPIPTLEDYCMGMLEGIAERGVVGEAHRVVEVRFAGPDEVEKARAGVGFSVRVKSRAWTRAGR